MKWAPVIDVRLPYPISANRYWGRRFVKPKGGKPGFIQDYVTPEARAYRETVGWMLRQAGMSTVIKGKVRVDLQLYPHCPQDWRLRQRKDPLRWDETVQRLDLDNARKVVTDALKEVAIEDDFWIWKDTGEVMEPRHDVEACVVVRICRAIPEEHPQQLLPLPEILQPRPAMADPFDFAKERA